MKRQYFFKVLFSVLIFVMVLGGFGFARKFEFGLEAGRKFRIKNLTDQNIYLNGKFHSRMQGMNKATLEILDITNGYGFYRGQYNHYSKNVGLNEPFILKQVYHTRFYKTPQGRMIISPEYFMPAIRSVPTFPTNGLNPGDEWTALGEEIHEGIFDKQQRIRFNMPVNYRYVGDVVINGKELSKVLLSYHIVHYPQNHPEIISFTGFSFTTYFWDHTIGAPHSYYERLSFMVTLKNGETVLYSGTSEAEVEVITDLKGDEKEALVTRITDSIKADAGARVRATNDAIIVNLENILFDINKATLKPQAFNALSKVAQILNDHPQLDIEVSGHTDITGREEFNQSLSELRAKSVADYLIERGIDPMRISYIGHSSRKPIASNATPEGRALNRRVEIKIITQE